ncbi:copper binding protein CusF [Paucimonas lemoignei]|uniref:Copper binding protein CusF n=2 Tax=Paucimonas lemoignei TaxID=29443 RepID=A0A4R3HP47_PAULE|nr:copper binding protein CusF [Paucimonas lemoignei]
MGCRPNQVKMPLAMSDGVVEEVDKENRSITLRHGPIKSATIEMGPMTMPFPVRDASLLAKVKVGDKVRFTAEFIDNEATITSLVVRK